MFVCMYKYVYFVDAYRVLLQDTPVVVYIVRVYVCMCVCMYKCVCFVDAYRVLLHDTPVVGYVCT